MDEVAGYASGQNAAAKQPDMMALGERLGRLLGNLREGNDRATQTLNRFCNEVPPPPNGPTAQIGPAEPPPGTLASFAMLLDRLNNESNRLESLSIKLAGTLG